jgi:FKBP-type peptidyl-prolyl cis-trans isomerase 2
LLKKKYNRRIERAVTAVFLLFLVLPGCAGHGNVRQESSGTVRPGDNVQIKYLCRLRTGEVAAATENVAEGEPKSDLYMARRETGPFSVKAIGPGELERAERPFEEEIKYQLSAAVVGMKEGEIRQAELTAEDIPMSEKRYISRLSRVRRRPKEVKMSVEEYTKKTGKTPEAGQSVNTSDPDFPGQVAEITDKDVVIRFAKTGDVIETPFGRGFIVEEGNEYLIYIDARKGALVRLGDTATRITDVDERAITIDFRNPFGGEALLCDVAVEKIADAKPIKSETAE